MAEIKTKVNEASVEEFLSKVEDEQKRKDCLYIKKLADVDRNVLQELIADSFERGP
jgi:hypothetical protein